MLYHPRASRIDKFFEVNKQKLEMWGVKGRTERDFVSLSEVITPDFPLLPRCLTEMRERLRLGVPAMQNWAVRSRSLSGRIKCRAEAEPQERDAV